MRVTPSSGQAFLWLVFYLPVKDEVAWQSEAEGIISDALELSNRFSSLSGEAPRILLSGDANFQPFCICEERDPKPLREATFRRVLSALKAELANPCSGATSVSPIWLPLRSKTVHVRCSDTHHCCGASGASRAIDLICASACLRVEVCIHNGVHCKGLGCTWDLCVEYTKGDHFLMEAHLLDTSVSCVAPAAVSLPCHWHEESLWEHGISRASRCLSSLTSVFGLVCSLVQSRPAPVGARLAFDQWLVDVLAWLLCLVESFVRDAWVLFAKLDRRVKAKRTRSEAYEQDDILEDTCRLLHCARAEGAWPQGAVATCLRWLKPPTIVPPNRLLVDDTWLSLEDSHTAWKTQLRTQGLWPSGFDTSFHDRVCSHVSHLLGHARAHNGLGIYDAAFLQPEWFRAVESISISPAPSPFLIPRCLLFLRPNAWHNAASKLQEACGPSLFCLRPKLWRFRSLVVKHKKGPCSMPSSYRFLAIADVHGLVQEQLLLGRINPLLHRSLEWFQTGYRFDVRNHHFTLSCLQHEYQHWNRCFIAVFADFVHAFPRGWRAAILEECHDCAGLRDGALALLGSIMERDCWRITLSGDSIVSTCEGIPEGSKYGPSCFNLLPNTLVKDFISANCGVSPKLQLPGEGTAGRVVAPLSRLLLMMW